MKIKLLISFLCLSVLASLAHTQTIEASKIDEFSFLPCSHLLGRADQTFETLQEEPTSKVYFIYYEGGQYPSYKKTRKGIEEKMLNPARGDALNRTKALSLHLTKYRKVPQDRIVLIDGGYMENYEVEIWIVPKNAQAPKPTPTLTEKDIKFRNGKPFRVADCQGGYDNS
jgi:hypothetical protein